MPIRKALASWDLRLRLGFGPVVWKENVSNDKMLIKELFFRIWDSVKFAKDTILSAAPVIYQVSVVWFILRWLITFKCKTSKIQTYLLTALIVMLHCLLQCTLWLIWNLPAFHIILHVARRYVDTLCHQRPPHSFSKWQWVKIVEIVESNILLIED